MKTKLTWWQIAGLAINFVGAVFLVLCIATDINDDLYLPLALFCIVIANALQLVINIRNNKKK